MSDNPQIAGQPVLDRADHVWVYRMHRKTRCWKCVLCGGVISQEPPVYPTPAGWLPDRFEPLRDEERSLCPNEVGP